MFQDYSVFLFIMHANRTWRWQKLTVIRRDLSDMMFTMTFGRNQTNYAGWGWDI